MKAVKTNNGLKIAKKMNTLLKRVGININNIYKINFLSTYWFKYPFITTKLIQ